MLGFAATALATYFAMMNPIANTPIFISLTADDDAATRRRIARRSLLIAFGIVAVVSLAGGLVFSLFDITVRALRIAGGVLVFAIGYHMLQGGGARPHTPSTADVEDSLTARLAVAVSPLAVPILAGPGAIVTAMNFAAGNEVVHMAISVAAYAVICLASYFCFVSAGWFVRHLGQNGLNVVTRLMGLIVATIGVGMLLDGVEQSIRAFLAAG